MSLITNRLKQKTSNLKKSLVRSYGAHACATEINSITTIQLERKSQLSFFIT